MCCDETAVLDLPPEVIEALASYRQLQRERPWDWGDDQIEMFRWMRFSRFGPLLEAFDRTGDWPAAVHELIDGNVPAGIVVVRIGEAGQLSWECGPPRAAIAGRETALDVIMVSAYAEEASVEIADQVVDVAANGAGYARIGIDGARTAVLARRADQSADLSGVVVVRADAVLTVRAPRCSRWSITDATGEAWFPSGVLPKWDVHDRPYFHAEETQVRVPVGALHVECTRGIEFDVVECDLQVHEDGAVVELDPPRLVDPAAEGWFGGNLHVHLNYSGDLVCTPQDAARMQHGEGLHLLNLTAASNQTSLIYDEALLDAYVGADLPWTDHEHVARMGVEYRNDLLGHVHALGLRAAPHRFQSGHERSQFPDDWPPNGTACEELRALDATIGYAHPAFTAFPEGETEAFFANPRSVEARELVVDAALGLVDSVDLISPFDDEGAIFLYHRLLSCGLQLAATAGTDAFLSFSHGPGVASNPPGWGRVYADLQGQPLTAVAFRDAIRARRTTVTNGPWLTFDVDGHGPGAAIALEPGSTVTVRAEVSGTATEELSIVGPDGVVASSAANHLRFEFVVSESSWLAAVARGPADRRTLDARALAHTSAVDIQVGGVRVARAADARWCLDFLDAFEDLLVREGRFSDREPQLADHRALLDQARAFYRSIV